jgi:hypothetical protein
MESQEPRYWLRFTAGERAAQRYPLPEGGTTLGRKPGNQIVVADPSVSGRHAEVFVEGDEVELVDLGSTNGTKVDGQRVQKCRLRHGQHIWIGNVELEFVDERSTRAARPARSESETAPEETGGGLELEEGDEVRTSPHIASTQAALERVSADRVASAGKRSLLVPLLLLLAAGAAAGSWWRWGRRSSSSGVAEIAEVPHNRLPDPSFEAEGDSDGASWTAQAEAPVTFGPAAFAAHQGRLGVGVDLAAGEWALSRSTELRVAERETLRLSGWLTTTGDARGRIGLEFLADGPDAPGFTAWSSCAAGETGAQSTVEQSLEIAVPPGYARARACLSAWAGAAGGRVGCDDLTLCPAESRPSAAATFTEHELRLLGDDPSCALLTRAGRVLLVASIRAARPERDAAQGGASVPASVAAAPAVWRARATEDGLALETEGQGADAPLFVRIASGALGSARDGGAAWIASTGPAGFQRHAGPFALERCGALLFGRGFDLVRIGFDEPVKLSGALDAEGLALEIDGARSLALKLAFQKERTEAQRLAREAEAREARGARGAATLAWKELLDRFPFEEALVARAESSRARLVQGGIADVDALAADVERARFFELADLYAACRARAEVLAEGWARTEVETPARGLLVDIEAELAELRAGGADEGRAQLEGVLEALDPERSPGLARLLRAALARRSGGAAASASEVAPGPSPPSADAPAGGGS